MIRFLLTLLANLVTAAVALLIAWWILPDQWMTVQWHGFFIAVAVLALVQAIIGPFIFNVARKHASALLGGIGLVSTFVALLVASLFNGGITISGWGWALAPLVVWIITALGGWILVGLIIERRFDRRAREKEIRRVTGAS
ncbi:MAG: hypothetical protein D3X82_17800 [Candidatus Leucobacter sulfamidivorax]|jgi:MFS family permease|nr:hypothetical protein [Candidatus Leucobacter sulfamidivorax]